MSKFNDFAKEFDAAFKAARDEYAAAYDNLVQARRVQTPTRRRGGLMTPPKTSSCEPQQRRSI